LANPQGIPAGLCNLIMDNLRELANAKLRENRKAREQLLALIAKGEALAFVGAGLSMPLQYPSWARLLEILTSEASQIGPFAASVAAKDDALMHAEEIQRFFNTHEMLWQFKNTLGREFAPKQKNNCTSTQRRLASLPFRGFVTTNYEHCIEQALTENAVEDGEKPPNDVCVVVKSNMADRHMVSRFLRSIVDDEGPHTRKVAHLHGSYSDTDNIIISASDYARAYGKQFEDGKIAKDTSVITLHSRLTWALFACRRMVFFGCSMDDPYVKAVLDAVSSDLWEAGQQIHYVVLGLDEALMPKIESQMARFRFYGLEVVLFDNWDGSFRELDRLIEEAAEMCQASTRPNDKISADFQSPERGQIQSTPLSKRSPPSVDLNWLEGVNETVAQSLMKNED
jgi:hypothetical protein